MKQFHRGKAARLLCIVLVCALAALCGCSEDQRKEEPAEDAEVRAQALERMEGAWACEDNPLGIPDVYVGYLQLEITAEGTFAMYDAEAGNPAIAGRFLFPEEGVVRLAGVNRADFDPPAPWASMEPDQQLAYQLKSETKLLLTYIDPETDDKMTLIFDKVKK